MYILTISILVLSCGSSNSNKTRTSPNPTINEVINDYFKSNRRYIKDYSVFRISSKKMKDHDIEVYNVLPEISEISYVVSIEDSLNNHFPTNYLEYKNKLFLWQEQGEKISDSVMKYLYNRKLVDSSYVKYQLGLISGEDHELLF